MAFCKYCGKQIPEGGSCDCAGAKAAGEVKETVENGVNTAENAVSEVKNEAAEAVSNATEKAADAANNVADGAANAVNNAVNEVKNDAAQAVNNAADAVNGVKNDTVQAAQNAGQQVNNAAQKAGINGADIAKKVDNIAGDISNNLPGSMKNNKNLVYIAVAAIAALILLLLCVLCLGGGAKGAVKKYVKAASNKNGGKTMMELTLPKSVIKELKDEDEYEDKVDSFNEMVEDMIDDLEDDETLPKFDKITRKEKLKKSDIRQAENYFEDMCEDYDADDDDIKVSQGFEMKVKTKFKNEDGETKHDTEKICVVKVKGDGWKIIPMSADELDYYDD